MVTCWTAEPVCAAALPSWAEVSARLTAECCTWPTSSRRLAIIVLNDVPEHDLCA